MKDVFRYSCYLTDENHKVEEVVIEALIEINKVNIYCLDKMEALMRNERKTRKSYA